MKDPVQERLKEALEDLITENKKARIEEALRNRTRYLTAVLEHQIHPHNASAVLRSMDCFGLQEFYLMESGQKQKVSLGIAKGAGKWMDVHHYRQADGRGIRDCLTDLKARGFRIAVTSPHIDGYTPEDLPLDKPLALVFGNERLGVSPEALSLADVHVQVPMWGFTESYNLSVCAALCFYTLVKRLRAENIAWQLSEADQAALRMQWYRKIIRRAELLEQKIADELNA
jgi:tRNA (guanosine-2'-O-)-methyltransferase